MSARRSAIDIVHDILKVCNKGSINKTAIMYQSNLSYDQLKRYLTILSEQRMIGRNDSGNFEITDRGQKTLAKVSRVLESTRALQRELDPGELVANGAVVNGAAAD
jgi:predicted transcriptional regulator